MIKQYSIFPACRFWCGLVFIIMPLLAKGQLSNDNAFNTTDRGFGFGDGFNGLVSAVQLQADGKVLVGGMFTSYSGAPRRGIARLKGNDKGLDSLFQVGTGFGGGFPGKIAVQPDGHILVVGSFTDYNGTPANHIVRLNPDGSIDNSFSLGGVGPEPTSFPLVAVEVLSNGKIMVAGNFSTFNGVDRGLVVRLNSNGTLDLSFDAGSGGLAAGSNLRDMAIQSDGKVLVGGSFMNSFNDSTLLGPLPKLLIRLKSTGGFDPLFIPPVDFSSSNGVKSISLTTSGGIFIGGNFRVLWQNGVYNQNISLLLPSGLVDQSFKSPFLDPAKVLNKVLVQGNKVIVAGDFTAINTFKRGRIGRLSADGSVDAQFAPDSAANGIVFAVAVVPTDGKIIVGGDFNRFDQRARYGIAKISALGIFDDPFTFNSGADRPVRALVVQPDGKALIAGEFGYFNWNYSNGIVRLLPNGQHDPTFSPGFGVNGVVMAMAIQPDGKILVAGKFDSYNNIRRNGIIRLLSDGSFDQSFNAGLATNETIYAVKIQKDGKILLGGDFSTFGNQSSSGIIRLHPNGLKDNDFFVGSGFNAPVRAIALMQDSIIMVGGDFTTVQGIGRKGIVRLRNNGMISGFNAGSGISSLGTVRAIFIQKNNQIIIGGNFSSYNGIARNNIARINPNGVLDNSFDALSIINGTVFDIHVDSVSKKVTAVGDFQGNKAIGRNHIVRMKTTGARDATSGSGSGASAPISSVEETASGDLLIGGLFTDFDGEGRNRVARLNDSLVTTTTWNGLAWDFGAPDSSLHAVVEGSFNMPGFLCVDMIINSGVNFRPTTEVTVLGNCESNTSNIEGKIVLSSPDEAQLFEGTAQHLTIDNPLGVSLNGSAFVKGTLKLEQGILNTMGQSFTMVSNETATSRIAKVESGAGILGDVTVQRYVPGGQKGWRFMGPPVTGQSQADWSDDFTILESSFFLHNESGTLNSGDQVNGWEYLPGSPAAGLTLGTGYRAYLMESFFNGSSTFDNTGPIQSGDFVFPVSFSATGYGGGGWNLIANPFVCEVDWHSFSKTSIDGQIHVWNGTQYGSYSQGSEIGVNGGDRYIPSCQGFFVHASAASPALIVTEDAKPVVAQNNSFLRAAVVDHPDVIRLTLRGPAGDKDETAIRLMPQTTENFDAFFDADKLPNESLSLFSMSGDGRKTSIQARPYVDGSDIFLGYSVKMEGNYSIQLHLGEGVLDGRTWYLRDNEYGYIYSLPADYNLNFAVSGGILESNSRFSLLGVTNTTTIKKSNEESSIVVFPNPAKGYFHLLNTENVKSVSIFDLNGKQIQAPQQVDLNQIRMSTAHLPKGFYLVKIMTPDAVLTRKILVE